jgi:hypothetical protein
MYGLTRRPHMKIFHIEGPNSELVELEDIETVGQMDRAGPRAPTPFEMNEMVVNQFTFARDGAC